MWGNINRKIIVLSALSMVSQVYAEDEIVGRWKTIDDKSGTVRSIFRFIKMGIKAIRAG